MTASEVHAAARAVRRFWFEEATPAQHFTKDDAFDAAIRDRFGDLHRRVAATGAAGWDEGPDTLLAAVIVLDQFSRNLFRGDARAFAGDPVALGLSRAALRHGWDMGLTGAERAFLYLPLMHSEDAADQAESVARYTDLGLADNLAYAIDHRDVIARFGRFPSRNAALGRASTPDEEVYLSQPGAGW